LRGDVVVEVKPGDAVLGVTEAWALERYVMAGKKDEVNNKKKGTSKKSKVKKK
jgi:hypothetical protein